MPNLVLKSIVYQNIPQYEIVLCGYYDTNKVPKAAQANLVYAKNKHAADAGLLGEMRNMGCKRAKHRNTSSQNVIIQIECDVRPSLPPPSSFFDGLPRRRRDSAIRRAGGLAEGTPEDAAPPSP